MLLRVQHDTALHDFLIYLIMYFTISSRRARQNFTARVKCDKYSILRAILKAELFVSVRGEERPVVLPNPLELQFLTDESRKVSMLLV